MSVERTQARETRRMRGLSLALFAAGSESDAIVEAHIRSLTNEPPIPVARINSR